MTKLISLIPRKIGIVVKRKNVTVRRLSESASPEKVVTFGFANELQKATGEDENKFVDRFVGQL